jgi:hypothetical protein
MEAAGIPAVVTPLSAIAAAVAERHGACVRRPASAREERAWEFDS